MKKELSLILLAALSLAACNENGIVPEASTTRIDAFILDESADGSRTAIGEKQGLNYPVLWTAGDCISVNGFDSEPLKEGDFSQRKASFTINGVVSAPYTAVYPLSAATYADGAYSVALPEIQKYVQDSFDPEAAVMLGSGSELKFQNVLSYIRLTVNKGETDAVIRSIKLSAGASEALSGSFTPTFGDVCSLSAVASEDGKTVTLDCGSEGVALGTPLYIAVPAYTYASGLNVTVRTTDGKEMTTVSSNPFPAVAGKIYSTSFIWKEATVDEPGIWTEEDLIAFLKAADGGDFSAWVEEDGKVHIKADITLTADVKWSETAEERSCTVEDFDGILDGGNHTVTLGGAVSSPLFRNLSGTVSNLILAGEQSSSSMSASFAYIVAENGKIENCVNRMNVTFSGKAGFAGIAHTNRGTISACSNEGALSLSTDLSRLGGIVYANEGTLSGCSNSGRISCPNRQCNVAGIAVGQKKSESGEYPLIENCTNSGEISVTGSGSRAGGICFNMNAGSVQNCSNTANITMITIPSDAGEVQFIGGIVGITSQHDLTLTGVQNIFGTNAVNIPTTSYSDNTLVSKLSIIGCTNTGILKMTVTPEATSACVRNVAIGGILGWNWAGSTEENYVEIRECTNGIPSADSGSQYYYIQFTQSANLPSYLSPALGGILGQSASYNIVSSQTVAPYTKGFRSSDLSEGMKIVIDGCKSYGVVTDMTSYSNNPSSTSTPTVRQIRGFGGIAGLIYGSSAEGLAARISNCEVKAYILAGVVQTGTAASKQSVENCVGGIAGAAAWCDVNGCKVSSPSATTGVGSFGRHAMAAGGVFGSATERYSVTDCDLNMALGFMCTKTAYYGLVVGGSNYANRTQGYDSIKGSVISGNRFNPETVRINANDISVTSDNFNDYLISEKDRTDNAANAWLTIENNSWTGQ